MNKKALSPLIATILLVVFALVIGTVTMNWGKAYVEKAGNAPEEKTPVHISIDVSTIDMSSLDGQLKLLQIEYISGKIDREEYLKKEQELIKR